MTNDLFADVDIDAPEAGASLNGTRGSLPLEGGLGRVFSSRPLGRVREDPNLSRFFAKSVTVVTVTVLIFSISIWLLFGKHNSSCLNPLADGGWVFASLGKSYR
jgi:hypothetical protein